MLASACAQSSKQVAQAPAPDEEAEPVRGGEEGSTRHVRTLDMDEDGNPEVKKYYREVADAGVKPHIENVGLLGEGGRAAFRARVTGRQEFFRFTEVPGVGALFEEDLPDVIEDGFVDGGAPTRIAGQNCNRDPPHPLT